MVENEIDADRNWRKSTEHPSTSKWVRDNFEVNEQIGSGTFGTVYLVTTRNASTTTGEQRKFALKQLTRTVLPRYIAMELKVLQSCCRNTSNIMTIQASYRDRDRVFIVMDYFEHDSIKDVITSLTTDDILDYMYNLLCALNYLHERAFIHRDIKPSNFLYNRKLRRYSLIDFGLAEVYDKSDTSSQCNLPVENEDFTIQTKKLRLSSTAITSNDHHRSVNRPLFVATTTAADLIDDKDTAIIRRPTKRRIPVAALNNESSATDCSINCSCVNDARVCHICVDKPRQIVNKAGTPGFRSPEVILRSAQQTPLIDIWAAGITFLSLCCKRHPIMRPADDFEALGQMASIFGGDKLKQLAIKLGKKLHIEPCPPGVDLVQFCRMSAASDETLLVSTAGAEPSCSICATYLVGARCCLCAKSFDQSLKQLDADERLVFEIIRQSLVVDPDNRHNARMLLTLFEKRLQKHCR